MKQFFTFLALSITLSLHSQSRGDSRITVALDDTSNIYQKIKTVLVRNNFVVKDLPAKDSLATYIREYKNMFTSVLAVINGSTVTISGVYNLKKVDDFGYNRPDKYRKRVTYYNGSKTWQLLEKIAVEIGGEITYQQ